MREHVKALKEQWERYCGTKRYCSHEKIQKLRKRMAELEFESRMCIDRHEYANAEIMMDERSVIKKQLDELLPVSYETYATREFAKDFKTVTAKTELIDQDRMFFRFHYYREYLGLEVKEIARMYGMSTSRYYRIYNAGIAKFFPEEATEELSEVG